MVDREPGFGRLRLRTCDRLSDQAKRVAILVLQSQKEGEGRARAQKGEALLDQD